MRRDDRAAAPAGHDPDLGWVVRFWAVVLLFLAVTAVRSMQVEVPFRDPYGVVWRSRLTTSLTLFPVLVLVDATRRAWTVDRRTRAVLEVLRRRWTVRRVFLALNGLFAYHLAYLCYRNLKSWDVFNEPRDRLLLASDRWLFLGHAPADVLHGLLGTQVAAHVLVAVYQSFSSLVILAVVASVVFPERMRDGYVFLASLTWVWMLGVASYYLVPSLGPFHSAPEQFTDLPDTVIQRNQAGLITSRSRLLADPAARDAFASVSAFASLHVAVSFMLLLMARYFRLRRTAWALAAFLGGTLLATVYWGWHFVLDDVAGLAIAPAAVLLGALLIHPRGRPGRGSAGDVLAGEPRPGRQPEHEGVAGGGVQAVLDPAPGDGVAE